MKKIIALMIACMCMLPLCAAFGEDALFTRELAEKSLVSVGNTQRLHKALEKARAGEKVTIAYIGGSITEGTAAQPRKTNCYAALSANEFAQNYMKFPAKLNYVNAGISATTSLVGITRVQRDVLRHNPDIVFVEFAVNDDGSKTHRQAYESLVRSLLKYESQPAVILIFSMYQNGTSQQANMQKIGEHYDLGMVSVRNGLYDAMTAGQFTWRDYSPDGVHPNTAGHRYMADMIACYFEEAVKTPPSPWQMPEDTRYGNLFEDIQNIRAGHSFIVDKGTFAYDSAYAGTYTRGWINRQLAKEKKPMVLKVDAREIIFVFQQENNRECGKAEVWVDGVRRALLRGYDPNSWGLPVAEHLHLGEGVHDIEIRMAAGDEGKRFTLLDMGYIQ